MDDIFDLLPINKEEWETVTKRIYNKELIGESVKLYNESNNNSDKEILQCKYCKEYSQWGDGIAWECESCGDIFCNNCEDIDIENDILCTQCKSS